MRLAVLSDIHGNLEALLAVLADLDAQAPDTVVCLGDSVGYGPDPQAVADVLKMRNIPQVMGNHEEGLVRPRARKFFNHLALETLDKTRDLLDPDTLASLKDLPAFMSLDDMLFVHGCPPSNIRVYLYQLEEKDFVRVMSACPQRIMFVGHTHELMLYTLDGGKLVRSGLPKGRRRLDPSAKHLVNVGSVGQPRDGDNRAKYVIYDTLAHDLDVRFVPYDYETTAAKILKRGIHQNYANMLY